MWMVAGRSVRLIAPPGAQSSRIPFCSSPSTGNGSPRSRWDVSYFLKASSEIVKMFICISICWQTAAIQRYNGNRKSLIAVNNGHVSHFQPNKTALWWRVLSKCCINNGPTIAPTGTAETEAEAEAQRQARRKPQIKAKIIKIEKIEAGNSTQAENNVK